MNLTRWQVGLMVCRGNMVEPHCRRIMVVLNNYWKAPSVVFHFWTRQVSSPWSVIQAHTPQIASVCSDQWLVFVACGLPQVCLLMDTVVQEVLASSWLSGLLKVNLHSMFMPIVPLLLATIMLIRNTLLNGPAKASSIIIVYASPMTKTSGLARIASARYTIACRKWGRFLERNLGGSESTTLILNNPGAGWVLTNASGAGIAHLISSVLERNTRLHANALPYLTFPLSVRSR